MKLDSPTEKLVSHLRDQLASIQMRRPEYSLRAFSRDLGVPAPVLSEVIRGKRPVTAKLAKKLCEGLEISDQELQRLFQSSNRRKYGEKEYLQLGQDEFDAVSDWKCFAILSLLEMEPPAVTLTGMAKKLGVAEKQVEHALAALERLKLISKDGTGFKSTGRSFTTTQDIPSSAIKKNHMQGFELARHALLNQEVECREFSANTMAVDSKDLPALKEELRKLRRRFAKKAENGKNKDSVYRLQLQFFSLTKKGKS